MKSLDTRHANALKRALQLDAYANQALRVVPYNEYAARAALNVATRAWNTVASIRMRMIREGLTPPEIAYF